MTRNIPTALVQTPVTPVSRTPFCRRHLLKVIASGIVVTGLAFGGERDIATPWASRTSSPTRVDDPLTAWASTDGSSASAADR